MLDILQLEAWKIKFDMYFNEGYREVKEVLRQVFTIDTAKTRELLLTSLSEGGEYEEYSKGKEIPADKLVKLYEKKFVTQDWGKRLEIPWQDLDDDKNAVVKKGILATVSGKGYARKKETEMTRLIADASTGAVFTSQDAVAICGNHTLKEEGSTVSNLITDPFSRDGLNVLEKKIGDNGFTSRKRVVDLLSDMKFLWYHPDLEDEVWKVINPKATEEPGTTERNKNRFAGKYIPLRLPYLRNHSGTEKYWGVSAPNMGLVLWNRTPHQFRAWINDRTGSRVFDGFGRFTVGCFDWRALWMSDGSA